MTARSISPLNAATGPHKGRLLILGTDRQTMSLLQATAEASGVQVVGLCQDPEKALRMVQDLRPTIVLSAIFFDGEPYGIELSRIIQEDLGVPVIFVGESDDPLLLLQIAMTQPAGYVTDARDRGYLEAVLSRALKGARTTVAGPY